MSATVVATALASVIPGTLVTTVQAGALTSADTQVALTADDFAGMLGGSDGGATLTATTSVGGSIALTLTTGTQ